MANPVGSSHPRRVDVAYQAVAATVCTAPQGDRLGGREDSNLQLFGAAVTEEQAKRSEVVRALRCAFNGALTPMVQFLLEHKDLSREELSQLRDLIDAARRSQGEAPGKAGRAARPPRRE